MVRKDLTMRSLKPRSTTGTSIGLKAWCYPGTAVANGTGGIVRDIVTSVTVTGDPDGTQCQADIEDILVFRHRLHRNGPGRSVTRRGGLREGTKFSTSKTARMMKAGRLFRSSIGIGKSGTGQGTGYGSILYSRPRSGDLP